jgi:hypothetical protein
MCKGHGHINVNLLWVCRDLCMMTLFRTFNYMDITTPCIFFTEFAPFLRKILIWEKFSINVIKYA